MSTMSPAEFARAHGVSRARVSQWKNEGRLVLVGKLINVEETNKNFRGARIAAFEKVKGQLPLNKKSSTALNLTPSNAVEVKSVDLGDYDRASVPYAVMNAAMAIESGAVDLACILASRLPISTIRAVVDEWVIRQREGWIGGPGLPTAVAEEDGWEPPPPAYAGWHAHPLFTGPALSAADWKQVQEDAAAPP